MGAIGARLSQGRRAMGVTLADAERATKVRAKYLHALEEDDYSKIPDAYARGFLRNYADYLGLDAGELLRQHRVEHPPPPIQGMPEPLDDLGPRHGGVPRQVWRWLGIGAAALVAFWTVVSLVIAAVSGGPPGKGTQGKAATKGAGESGKAAVQAGKTVVSIGPKEGARPYVEVSVDGKVKLSGNLPKTARYAGGSVRVRTMFPDQISLVADGKRVEIPPGVALPFDRTFLAR